jgi:hypothetical protein
MYPKRELSPFSTSPRMKRSISFEKKFNYYPTKNLKRYESPKRQLYLSVDRKSPSRRAM